MEENEEKLFGMSRTLVEGMGFTLVDVRESIDRGRRVFCFYIDHPSGVTVGDCGDVSRELAYLLDAAPDFDEGYVLEVSSPGLEHKLRKEREYAHFAGREARLVLRAPVAGEPVLTGTIAGASDGKVRIVTADGSERIVAIDCISRASLATDDAARPRRG
jgi:ribosome maturation factor RimP